MPYDPNIHHRRSIRLQGYDYAQAGAYFITICTQNRECLLAASSTTDGIVLNDAGRMVEGWWGALESKFPNVITDAFVVMPNHIHGIVILTEERPDDGVGADLRVGPGVADAHIDRGAHTGADISPGSSVGADLRVGPGVAGARIDRGTHIDEGARSDRGAHTGAPLPEIVQWFKTMTTNAYIRGVKSLAWTPFAGRLWQRNYFERVIRDESALERARQYIDDNPARWIFDKENPTVLSGTGASRA